MRATAATLLLLLAATVSAETLQPRFDPVVRVFDSEDGLPQNSINSIVRAQDGHLWLGTFGGLARFDGYGFETFPSRADSGPSSDRILALLQDARGRLWIGTENAGLNVLQDGEFIRLDACGGRCKVTGLLQVNDREVWALTDSGVIAVDADAGFGFRTLVDLPRSGYVTGLRTPSGDVYLGGDRGLLRLRAGQWQNLNADEPAPEPIRSMAHVNGAVWFVTPRQVWRIDPDDDRIEPAIPGEAQSRVGALAQDADGNIWIGRSGVGLRHYSAVGELLSRVQELPTQLYHTLLVDPTGTLWLGTNGSGLVRITAPRIGQLGGPGSALDGAVLPIEPDGAGGFWLGSVCNGLYHLDAQFQLSHTALDATLGSECVWALHRSPDGGLWIGTYGGRLGRLDPASGELQADPRWPGRDVIRAIHDDGETLLIGTDNGARHLVGDRFMPIEALGSRSINSIRPARAGGLWVTGDEGVQRLQDGAVVQRIGVAEGLSSRFARALWEDPDGVLWIGTYGGGLNRFEKGGLRHFGTDDGMAENVVSCILPDNEGRLWMSGNRGISHVKRSQLEAGGGKPVQAVLLARADGLAQPESNGGGQPACSRDSRGWLWFPTVSGYAVVDPTLLAASANAPNAVLRAVSVDGRRFPMSDPVRLAPSTRDLQLDYGALDLGAADQLRFRYRLAGHDSEWIQAGAARTARFALVPYGELAFEVAASREAGVWGPAASLRLLHLRPWYQHPLTWVLAGAVFLLAAVLALRQRTRQLRLRAQRLDHLVGQRTDELAAANQQLRQLAQRDGLTGVANHRAFLEQLEQDWRVGLRNGTPVGLIMFDVDHLKHYNDHYGHLAGDDCLRRIAAAAQGVLRTGDLLARHGGEEFVAILPLAGRESAAAVAERIRAAVEALAEAQAPNMGSRLVSVSAGIASLVPEGDATPRDLVALADAALRRAKSAGRNCQVLAEAVGEAEEPG